MELMVFEGITWLLPCVDVEGGPTGCDTFTEEQECVGTERGRAALQSQREKNKKCLALPQIYEQLHIRVFLDQPVVKAHSINKNIFFLI